MNDEKLLTVKEVATILKIDRQTVLQWVKKGKLMFHKPGRKYLFSRKHVDELLSQE